MDTATPVATPTVQPAAPENPHILWRQVLGFVLWVGLLSLLAGGPLDAVLYLALGGATFADAWKSGIYKRWDKKSFLNISPMAWGIAMALLFIVAYPAYLLNRNELRTKQSTNVFFWATVVLGAVVIILSVLKIVARFGFGAR